MKYLTLIFLIGLATPLTQAFAQDSCQNEVAQVIGVVTNLTERAGGCTMKVAFKSYDLHGLCPLFRVDVEQQGIEIGTSSRGDGCNEKYQLHQEVSGYLIKDQSGVIRFDQ